MMTIPANPQPNRGRNVVFGCLIAAALAVVLVIALVYFLIIKPAANLVGNAAGIGQITELDGQVRNTQAYTPPADGRLSAMQVERLLYVQQQVQAKIGQKSEQFNNRLKDGQNPSISESIAAAGDFLGVFADAKRAQVEALNARGLSMSEYVWVRAQAYRALGFPDVFVNFATSETVTVPASSPEALEANRVLVEPHRDDLTRFYPIAGMGL